MMVKLPKEVYYERRWLKATLWFLFSVVLVVYGIIGLNNDKPYNELLILEEPIIGLKAEARSNSKVFLRLFTESKQLECFITEEQFNNLWSYLNSDELPENPFYKKGVIQQAFKGLLVQVKYWDIFLFELKINNNTIIPYERKGKKLPIGMLIIGLMSIGFQSWVIYTLLIKGREGFYKMYKN